VERKNMPRLKLVIFLILYLSIFSSACYTTNGNENTPSIDNEEMLEPNPSILIETPISIDVKIGQMLMVGFRGISVNKTSPIIQDIKKYHLGGIILFDYDTPTHNPIRNITSPKQLRNLIEGLQVVSSRPLFIAIDQEGGKITRLKRRFGFPATVSAQYLGEKNRVDFTYKEAEKIAKTLASVGINFNFAPVVDVNVNPNNPVIGRLRRSFSANPDIVTRHALAFIKAHHKHKIITVLKHFPGHGSSTADSHLAWADVSDTWQGIELNPYRDIILSNQADAIMIAHVFNKLLDSEYPATLSKQTVTGLLRGDLGYKGVVVSDDMQMKAVAKHYKFKEAIMRTIQAGIDIIVIGNNLTYEPKIASRTVRVIKELIKEGKITERRIDESYRRIQDLKKRWIPNRYKLTVAK
jgi:beta-N-acetylhexosaminidase